MVISLGVSYGGFSYGAHGPKGPNGPMGPYGPVRRRALARWGLWAHVAPWVYGPMQMNERGEPAVGGGPSQPASGERAAGGGRRARLAKEIAQGLGGLGSL